MSPTHLHGCVSGTLELRGKKSAGKYYLPIFTSHVWTTKQRAQAKTQFDKPHKNLRRVSRAGAHKHSNFPPFLDYLSLQQLHFSEIPSLNSSQCGAMR